MTASGPPADRLQAVADGRIGPEQLAALDAALAQAEAEGILGPAVESADRPAGSADAARHDAAAVRLALLGYLDVRPPRAAAAPGPAFRAALAGFQREAGIAEAGLGPKTWAALDGLVAFESDVDVRRWFTEGRPAAPLRRAVGARLQALGMLERPDLRRIPAGLAHLREAEEGLGLTPPAANRLTPETAAWVLEHDARVGRLRRSRRFAREAVGRGSDIHRWRTRLVVALARIELWLAGHDVSLAAPLEYEPPRGGMPRRPSTVSGTLYGELAEFWREAGARDPWRSASRIGPRLFDVLAADDALPAPAEHAVPIALAATERLAEQPAAAQPGLVERLQEELRERASRLWDGFRRALAWLRRQIGRLLQGLARGIALGRRAVRNLARLLFRLGGHAFGTARTALGAVRTTVQFLVDRTPDCGDPRQLALRCGIDGDVLAVVPAGAETRAALAIAQQFRAEAALFRRVAPAVVGFAADALRFVALGYGGWLWLFLALVRSYRRWNAIAAGTA